MRFFILSMFALVSTASFAQASGSGFEGTYKVEKITATTGSWTKAFWGRPDISKLSEIVLEDLNDNLYINLQDTNGMAWSANYGVCTGTPGEYCNAKKSADGRTLELQYEGDWQVLKIILGQNQGRMILTGDKGPASIVFEYSRK